MSLTAGVLSVRVTEEPAVWIWQLPPGFPEPIVPADNPMSVVKVELGRLLFYDTRLSGNAAAACASCHRPELAFTDGRARAVGATGEIHPRSAPSLANAAYNPGLGWIDPHLSSLEEQALLPLRNNDPVELGVAGAESEVLARLRAWPRYRSLFAEAFPESLEPIDLENVGRALAAFERTLVSGGSPYDGLVYSDEAEALGPEARAGMRLFFSERVGCSACHFGIGFAGPVAYRGGGAAEPLFANNGLVGFAPGSSPPSAERGLALTTGNADDLARFRVPSLRNVAVTAPYMHDGRLATLDEVIDHYASGGRESPTRATRLRPFALSSDEKARLIAFLESLTDEGFLHDERLASPFPAEGAAP